MPYRRSYSRSAPRSGRRSYRRATYKGRGAGRRSRPRKGKYTRYRRRTWNPRANSILSLDRYYAKLRFQDSIELRLNGASFTDQLQYSLNSVYDPYYGIGGGTVKGHAEFASIWSKYMVMGASFKLKGAFWSDRPDDMSNLSRPYAAYIQAVDSAHSAVPPLPDIDTLSEQSSECRYHVVVPAYGTPQRLCMIKRYFPVKVVEGASISGNIEEYAAATNDDPVLQPSVLVGITQVDMTGYHNIMFSGQLIIKYYVRYLNRHDNIA